MKTRALASCAVLAAAMIANLAMAQGGPWQVNRSADAGPLAQLDLPNAAGKRRAVLIAFEYARRCDPIFSFAEFAGSRPGTPKSQSRLNGTKIGVILNGDFYTWHAAQTIYDNGYEAGFGMPNDLVMEMLLKVNSLEYVTPSGERIPLSTSNFARAFREAIDHCRSRVK
jgi:hypothetical protein